MSLSPARCKHAWLVGGREVVSASVSVQLNVQESPRNSLPCYSPVLSSWFRRKSALGWYRPSVGGSQRRSAGTVVVVYFV